MPAARDRHAGTCALGRFIYIGGLRIEGHTPPTKEEFDKGTIELDTRQRTKLMLGE